MMRSVVVAFSVFLAAWTSAEAQVEVRSGEHSGFTRLVIYFDEPKEWELGRIKNGYGLRVEENEKRYELGAVFSFIPRSRIVDIKEVPNGLNILSSCECYANAYNYSPGVLVVDIRSGTAPEDARFEESLEVEWPRNEQSLSPSLPTLSARMVSSGTAKVNQTRNLDQPKMKADSKRMVNSWTQLDLANRLPSLERQLAQRLGGALSQQLLTPTQNHSERLQDSSPVARVSKFQKEIAVGVPSEAATFNSGTNLLNLPNVSVHSALDTLVDPQDESDNAHCMNGEYFSFTPVDGDEMAILGLSRAREAFLEDLTSPSQNSVLALAKSYLALGFGAEAGQVLDQYPDDSLQAKNLNLLASLVDQPELGVAGDLRSQVSCGTDAALWALLAHGSDRPVNSVNEKAILRTVSALPLHLRRHLVPTISERLRRLGYASAAADIRETVLRAEDVPNAPLDLEVSAAEDSLDSVHRTVSRTDVLIDAAKPTSSVSELAAAGLLDDLEKAGRFAPDSLLLQVASEIHATRGSKKGQGLLNSYMTALGRRGLSQPAIDMLSRLDRSRFSEAYDLSNAADLFLRALEEDAASGAFAIGAVAFEDGFDLQRVPSDVRNQVAARLSKLNLSEQAAAYRSIDPVGANSEADPEVLEADHLVTEAVQNVLLDHGQGQGLNSPPQTLSGAPGQLAWILQEWSEAEQLLPDGARKRMASRLAENQKLVNAASSVARESTSAERVTLAHTRDVLSQATDLRQDLAELGIMPEG